MFIKTETDTLSLNQPDPPNPPPNWGAAKAAAISAKRTTKNFMFSNLITNWNYVGLRIIQRFLYEKKISSMFENPSSYERQCSLKNLGNSHRFWWHRIKQENPASSEKSSSSLENFNLVYFFCLIEPSQTIDVNSVSINKKKNSPTSNHHHRKYHN